MLANLGFYIILLCFILSVYGAFASFIAGLTRHRKLYLSSKSALVTLSVLVVGASGLLVYLLFERDYSVAYIAKNTSNDLPMFYTFTALWCSLEGSHLLWTTLLAVVAAIAALTHAKDNEHIMPYVLTALMAVLGWMFYLLMTHSDPFKLQLPKVANGNGMNEVLQNPYMAIHPPLLFLGYVGTAIPFAYSLAALAYGDITEGWLKSVRRWAVFAWCFLTVSIALGGRWAYVELGWAGYWAWDPVENSSFLPWLTTTALLHGLLVQEKLGHLKRLSLILAISGFFLTFFGTFITRSGVISSVHAFGEGPIGPNYLMFLAVIAMVSTVLYAIRAPSLLPAESEKVWGVSKESALAVCQFLLIAFSVIIFIGTVFPIVSEALTDQRISITAPYFNIFAPYIGLGLVLMLGIGNLMRYRNAALDSVKKVVPLSLGLAIPLTVLLSYLGDVFAMSEGVDLYAQLLGFYSLSFCLFCLILDFWLKLKDFQFKFGFFVKRNLAFTGAFIAHVGFLIAIAGFLGNYRGMDKVVTLDVGESAELFGYEFTFKSGIEVSEVENVTLFAAPLEVNRFGKKVAEMAPAQSRYPTKPGQPFNEIAVDGGFWRDLYVVLNDFDRKTGKQATLHIHINPTVKMVWLAIAVMFLGGMVSLFDRRRGNRSRDVIAGNFELGGQTS